MAFQPCGKRRECLEVNMLLKFGNRGWSIILVAAPRVLVLLFLGLFVRVHGEEPSLPPARELIDQSLKICGEASEDNTWPRSKIAVALAYLGDFDKARLLLADHQLNIWIEAGYWGLAEAEIAHGRDVTPFPPALATLLI